MIWSMGKERLPRSLTPMALGFHNITNIERDGLALETGGYIKVSTSETTGRPSGENDMVYFAGGTFQMESSTGTPQKQFVHQSEVQEFWIDKHPVTVKEFRQFIQQTGRQTDADKYGDSGVFNFNTSA